MPLCGLAYQRDLYTSSLPGEEADEFEHWISRDFERPASDAIDKVVNGTRLKREDWHSLAKFFALQDVRTPASFFAQMERWDRDMPALLESTVKEALQEWQERRHESRVLVHDSAPENHFAGLFDIAIERPKVAEGQAFVRTNITLGRRLWLASMRHILTGVARILCEHQWSIAEPADGVEWPLTDHPALKLNYRGPTDYDFGGGWGVRKTNLLMPLSPRHLLFVEIGNDSGRKLTLTLDQTRRLRRLLIERAHRWVFATRPLDSIVQARPRVVSRDAFEREAERWQRWHDDQLQAETAASVVT